MTKENDVEKLFSEDIDCMLAGEESKTDASGSHDLRTAMDFAQKMVALRAEPSAQFKANLKAKLLRQLAEQETRAQPGWLRKLWPRQVVWQVVYAALFVVIAGGIVWSTGVLRSGVTPTAPSTQAVFLQADASTDKFTYRAGEPVKIQVALKNVTSEPFQMEQFPPILSLMRTETRQPVYTFGAGSVSRTLAPNETATFVVAWDQRDDRGRYVPGGNYYLELEDLDLPDQRIKLNLTPPVGFDILPSRS